MRKSLNGMRFCVEFFDLLEVDVSFSADKKSFDATAVLRSTYHTAWLERGLASLPAPVLPVPAGPPGVAGVQAPLLPVTPVPPPVVPDPPSLHNADLVQGPGPDQLYPTRLLTRSLDGEPHPLRHMRRRTLVWSVASGGLGH